MSRLARLQLIGPAVLLLGIASAEITALGLGRDPASEILWHAHVTLGPLRHGNDILSALLGSTHGQLALIGMPLLLMISGGFYFRSALPLAVASNVTFVYASFLFYAWHARDSVRVTSITGVANVAAPDLYLGLALLACALMSSVVSHILYLRAIRQRPG